MASLNRLKLSQKSNTYRNEYEFSETITKIVFWSTSYSFWSIRTHFGHFVLI